MRRNNMDTIIVKFLLTGASVVLTCVLISIGMIHFKQGQGLANAMSGKINAFQTALSQSDITMLDGMSVNGSDVINFYKKYLGSIHLGLEGEFPITVQTTEGKNTYQDGSYLTSMKDNQSNHYIQPAERFHGVVEKNDNGVIVEVSFIQDTF